ncbi:hypothetical protein HanRHA438_Chr13g0624701 [Helianthus annuus]|nr:hypothetical protein HanRHA438_Chr13g0624701 [Helianthus annuus]
MMIGRLNRKARPVLREKNDDRLTEEAPLWRMFCPDFEGNADIVTCGAGEEGWNRTILCNFRMPDEAALNAVLPGGKCIDILAPWETLLQWVTLHEAVSVPSLVPEVAGILRTCLRKYEDYVVVSDTLEGLGVPGGSAGAGGATTGTKPVDVKKRKGDAHVAGGEEVPAGGATTGTKPVDVKKRKGDAHVAGGEEVPELRKTRTIAVPKPNPAVSTGPMKEPVSLFATPPSSPKVVDVEVQKKGGEDPSIEVVSSGDTPPSVHAEQASKETTGGTIFDTLDSSNNLIDPQDDGGQGLGSRSPLFLKRHPVLPPRARGLKINPPFSLGRVNWSSITALMRQSEVLTTTVPLGMFCRGIM